MKPASKASGSKRLKLEHDKLLSKLAFKFQHAPLQPGHGQLHALAGVGASRRGGGRRGRAVRLLLATSRDAVLLKLSVGVTCHAYLLETEGLFTQGS
jgi:hypothetical protein